MRVWLIGALVVLLFAAAAQLGIGGWGHWGALLDGHGWLRQFGLHAWRSLEDGCRSRFLRFANVAKLPGRGERASASPGMIPDETGMQA